MLAGCPAAAFRFVNLAAGTDSPNWTGCTAARPAGGAEAGAWAGVWARLAATATRSAAKRLAAAIDFGRFIESTSNGTRDCSPAGAGPQSGGGRGDRFASSSRRVSEAVPSGAGKEVEGDGQDHVDAEKLRPFDPVRLAVHGDEGGHAGGDGDGEDLEGGEDEVHGVAEGIAGEDEDGGDEEGHLGARTDGDPHREVHLVPHRHQDGGGVLGGVSDDGDQDDAGEDLGEAELLGGGDDG